MRDIINQHNFNSILPREPFFDYDPIGKSVMISLPESVFSGTSTLMPADNNNIGFLKNANSVDIFTFTAGAIAYGEASKISNQYCSNMTGKVNLICGEYRDDTDLYGTNSCEWSKPVHVMLTSSDTSQVYKEFTIQLNYDPSVYSWTLTSTISPVTILLNDGALRPNRGGRRGDLNLIALIFIFIVAKLKVMLCPKEDKHIKEVFKTIL
jgi:hypothetical protein